MASVFKRPGSSLYIAKIRAWDASKSAWCWTQQPTGQADKGKALGIASVLEGVASKAKAGTMTREKALQAVNDILRLSGVDLLGSVPTLREIARQLIDKPSLATNSTRRYESFLACLEAWSERKCSGPVDAVTVADCQAFYTHSLLEVSPDTARQRLNFLSMILTRAVTLGFRTNNPTLAVEKKNKVASEKGIITRKDCAKILRLMRKKKRRDWCTLTLLGWHTGHRIQDLLDTREEMLDGDLLTINPRKKAGRGREIVLPLPRYLCAMIRAGRLAQLQRRGNRSGHISNRFIELVELAGIDPGYVQHKARRVPTISFHSFRHSMVSRLTAAGVSADVARMVTDHDSVAIHRRYQHAEVESLREALRKAR